MRLIQNSRTLRKLRYTRMAGCAFAWLFPSLRSFSILLCGFYGRFRQMLRFPLDLAEEVHKYELRRLQHQ
jgi:hypothetical protein